MKSIEQVLIYRVGNLGDTICAIPSMVAVRQRFPNANIVLLTNKSDPGQPDCEQILKGNDYIDRFITYSPERLREPGYLFWLFKTIFALKSDLLVYLALSESKRQRLIRDWLFFKFAGSKYCLGFKLPQPIDSFISDGNVLPVFLQETDRLMSLLLPLGISADQVNFKLPITEADTDEVERLCRKNKLDLACKVVAVCPASKFQSKLWPVERFAEVIDYIVNAHGVKVVLIGGSSEKIAGERICAHTGESVINLIGKTNFMQTAVLLSRCVLLVANDCGPVHLAAAVATPVVGIYASIHYPGAWHPWGSIHTVLRNDSFACRFCFKKECSLMSCISSITTDQVTKACSDHLSS